MRIGPFGKKRAEEKALKEAVKAMNACLEKVAEWSQEILYESYYDKINAIYDGLKQIDITNPKPDQLTALSELHLFENLLDSFSENKDELIAAKAQEIIDLLTGKYVDEILEEEES